MKKTLITLMVISVVLGFLRGNVQAAETTSVDKWITQGHVQVAGSGSYSSSSGNIRSQTRLFLAPSVEYFIMDHFSLGGSLNWLSISDTPSDVSFGPSATYYFFESDRWAGSLEFGAAFGLSESAYDSFISGGLGLRYFFVPSVAIGPRVLVQNFSDRGLSFQKIGILANFSIYL